MSDSNVDIIKRVYDAFQTRDFGVIGEVFDPQVEIHQSERLPWGGHFKGHEGAVAFFTGLLGHIDPRLTVEQIIDAGDHVVEIGRTIGHTTAGAPFDLPETHVWELSGGKIVRMEIYIDTPAMLAILA
ncbi:nuclear transport factor 2 family protein [Sphaerisporangium sp. NPDC049003]|uniref:nuclear transport factor 2 family protein n=1 Tax=Sphaerisporangium sp. NPDC049003 TaxID=3364517 RepID=UPI0037161202